MIRLLLIEDNFDTKDNIKEFFTSYLSDVITIEYVSDCHEGLKRIRSEKYDIVVVDVRFSKVTGIDTCRIMREHFPGPVLLATDLDASFDVYDYGNALMADDYIIRPVIPEELYVMVLDNLKKSRTESSVHVLEYGGVRMNPHTGSVNVDGRSAELTPKASRILQILLENKPNVVSRETLLKEVWGDGYNGSNRVVDTQIKNLRHQLGNKGELIKTVKGKGYSIGGK